MFDFVMVIVFGGFVLTGLGLFLVGSSLQQAWEAIRELEEYAYNKAAPDILSHPMLDDIDETA